MHVSFVIEPHQSVTDSFAGFPSSTLEPERLTGALCVERKRHLLPLRGDLLALLPQFLEAVYDLLTAMQSEVTLAGENGSLTLTRSYGSVRLRWAEGESRQPLQMRVNLRALATASVKGAQAFQNQLHEAHTGLGLHPAVQRVISLQHTLQETLAARAKRPLRQRLSAYLPALPPRTLNALFVCLLALVVFQSVLLWRGRRTSTTPVVVDSDALQEAFAKKNQRASVPALKDGVTDEKAAGRRPGAVPGTSPPSDVPPSSPRLPTIPGGEMAQPPPMGYSGQQVQPLPPMGITPPPMGAAALPQPPASPHPPPAKLVGVIEYNGESP